MDNDRVFKIDFVRSMNFLIFLLFLFLGIGFITLNIIYLNQAMFISALFVPICLLFQFVAWYYAKTSYSVSSDGIRMVRPDKTICGRWGEIKKVRRLFTIYAGYSYFVYTKNGIIGIPDSVQGIDELLGIIQERTGKKIKREFSREKD